MHAAVILGSLVLAVASVCARADLLWDNGEWDGGKVISSERNTLIPVSWFVDDFILPERATVRELEWLALKAEGTEPVAADLIVLDAQFGVVTELFDREYAAVYEGIAWSQEIWRLTLSDLSIDLAPGRYYIGARFVGDGTGRGFAAAQYPIHGETEAYFRSEYFGYPDWTPTREFGLIVDAVFKVYGGVIPAPATLSLLLCGVCARRRKR